MCSRFAFLGAATLAAALLAACDSTPSEPTGSQPASPTFATSAPGKPTRSPLPQEAFAFPAGTACSFALGYEPLVNRVVVKTFPPEANGDVLQIITGTLTVRLTNLATDEAITLNLSGPGRVTFHPDGSITFVNGGFGLIVVFPTDIPAGPRTILTAGRLVQTLTATGQLIVVSLAGRQEDVCATLS